MRKFFLCFTLFTIGLTSCTRVVAVPQEDKVSVGTVQREIRVGLSGADVAAILGSPNMVTTDANRNETWVYDKISTERFATSSSGSLWIIIAGTHGGNAYSSTSQRTLTIIIKFDEKGLVRDYSYRQSSF